MSAARIAVLGAGAWGTALAVHLARQGHTITLWERDAAQAARLQAERANAQFLPGVAFPDGLSTSADLEALLPAAEAVLMVIPSAGFRGLVQRLQPLLAPAQGLAWATKGLEYGSGKLLHTVAREELPASVPLAMLSGPSFAAEVARGLPTAIALAADDPAHGRHWQALLHGPTFRTYLSQDLPGVGLAGAYKNVLAIAAGISDGLRYGHNARAALITRGLAEMTRLGLRLGGRLETFMGLAGLGDLVLTCTGDLSRNRRLGFALAAGQTLEQAQQVIGQVTEGVDSARAILTLNTTHGEDLPIATQVARILFEGLPATEAVRELLARDPRTESD
jgi:glycerol-3-phosphate dehydrogenase (NAD(P)+)